MSIQLNRPTRRVCLRLYGDDLDYLAGLNRTGGGKGYNSLIRAIVDSAVKQLRDRERRILDQSLGHLSVEITPEMLEEIGEEE